MLEIILALALICVLVALGLIIFITESWFTSLLLLCGLGLVCLAVLWSLVSDIINGIRNWRRGRS